MSAGWLYYRRYPPKRKCKFCGKRHSLRREGVMSNGADVWRLVCTATSKADGVLASDWPEGGLL